MQYLSCVYKGQKRIIYGIVIFAGGIGNGGCGKCRDVDIHMLRGRSLVNPQMGRRVLQPDVRDAAPTPSI